MSTKTFAVLGRQTDGHRRLFSLLSELFEVRFSSLSEGDGDGSAGVIALDGAEESTTGNAALTAHHSYIVNCGASVQKPARHPTVRFSDSTQLPACLRGLTLETMEAGEVRPFGKPTGEVLASVADLPVWTLCRSNGHICHRVSLPLPELGA